ncbi:taste receptor type 1 member 2-like [Hypanus sabinus]|uniref:taste receptor type 1 member 2-like n=1 Tax=Hypanus sabinus TaxID=79690 RepID=UPI0028C38E51|nr:taste receptor type 1 member 2-like [Hypanus sabinus]
MTRGLDGLSPSQIEKVRNLGPEARDGCSVRVTRLWAELRLHPATKKMYLLLTLLVYSTTLGPVSVIPEGCTRILTAPGEYVIGGLFPIHTLPFNDVDRSEPVVPSCGKSTFKAEMFVSFQAMRYAIEEINNSTELLPGVTLGYDVADSCLEVVDVQAMFRFLSAKEGTEVEILNNYTSYQPRVIAVIGPPTTDTAIIIARVLGFFLIPQISYLASGEILSDKIRFPSFMRTIPSDKNQAEAMTLLIQEFRWNWVAVIGSDNEYGHKGVSKVVEMASALGICIAYQGIITTSPEIIIQAINNISTTVNVTILFSSSLIAHVFFSIVVVRKLTPKVWIVSESISSSEEIANIPNIETIGTVIGIAVQEGKMTHFKEFLDKPRNEINSWIMPDLELGECVSTRSTCDQGCSESHWQWTKYLNSSSYNVEKRISYNVYSAVYAVAYGLHSLLQCNTTHCDKTQSVLPWQIPFSNCSAKCDLGQKKVPRGIFPCCFSCEDCPSGTYLNQSDPYCCVDCPWHQWSSPKSHRCLERDLKYLEWQSAFSIFLLVLTNGGLVLTIIIAIIFILNYNTPVVRSSGGRMCFLMLTSMLCSFSCVFFYIDKPSKVFCQIRQPFFTVNFTICLSCILVRSFQIVCIFKMAAKLPKAHEYWVKYNGQYIFIFLSTLIQIIISTVWLITDPPRPHGHIIEGAIVLDCNTGNIVAFSLSLLYTVFLTVACFLFAYMGRDLPKNYNEAKFIAFSMMICFVYYILFMTSMVTPNQERYISFIQTFLTVTSAFSIALGYFIPKCYIILFMPQNNTMVYFQSCIQDYTKKQNEAN